MVYRNIFILNSYISRLLGLFLLYQARRLAMLRNNTAVSLVSQSTNVEQRCPAVWYSDSLPETAVFRFHAVVEVFATVTISRQASGCTVPPVGCTERLASAPLCAVIL